MNVLIILNDYSLTSSGTINILTNSNKNIKLTRYNDGTNLDLQSEWAYLKVGNNSNNMLAISSNTGQTTQLKSEASIGINSQNRIQINSVQNINGQGGSSVANNSLVLQTSAKDASDKRYTRLMLNPRSPNNDVPNYMFYLDCGKSDDGISDIGRLSFETSKVNNVLQSQFYIGGNSQISAGLKINGNYLGNDYGLRVEDNISCGKNISADTFSGNGANITNTANGSSATGGNISVSGVGGKLDVTLPTIDLVNGRPNIGSRNLYIGMPDKDQIWNEISEKVASAISTALSSYVTTDTFNAGLNGKVDTSTYNTHKHGAPAGMETYMTNSVSGYVMVPNKDNVPTRYNVLFSYSTAVETGTPR